jgi:hypothetical protein
VIQVFSAFLEIERYHDMVFMEFHFILSSSSCSQF